MSGPEHKLHTNLMKWINTQYADWIKQGHLIVRKFQGGVYGTNGWPDLDFYYLWTPGVLRVWKIELKAPGGTCSELQLERHKQLRACGVPTYVADNLAAAKAIIVTEINGGKRPPLSRRIL